MAITYKSTVYACAVQGIWVTVLLRCWVFMSALNGQRTNIMKFEASRGDDYRNNCSCKLTTMSRFVAIQSFSSVCILYSHSVLCVHCMLSDITGGSANTRLSELITREYEHQLSSARYERPRERQHRVKRKSKLVQE